MSLVWMRTNMILRLKTLVWRRAQKTWPHQGRTSMLLTREVTRKGSEDRALSSLRIPLRRENLRLKMNLLHYRKSC